MRKQILPHFGPVTPGIIPANPLVFIEIKARDLGKGQSLLTVPANQFRVERQGRTSRRQTKHNLLPASQECLHLVRHLGAQFIRIHHANPFFTNIHKIHKSRNSLEKKIVDIFDGCSTVNFQK